MTRYILRRLVQSLFTVFGVMLLTFVLFRVIAGDVSVAYVNQKLGMEARQAFYERHKLDRPALFNRHRRLEIVDHTDGHAVFAVTDRYGSLLAKNLQMHLAPSRPGTGDARELVIASRLIPALSERTALAAMTGGKPVAAPRDTADAAAPAVSITASDGASFTVPVDAGLACGGLVAAINGAPGNGGRITARLSARRPADLFDSQFFWHLWENVTFSGRSYATDQDLLEIIGDRARFSLAITVPAMALGWILAMVISCFVAYYRDTWIDRVGVLLSVLGMCLPYLAYMLLGQWLMFKIAPELAVGLSHPASIYVPVMISVAAGLGWSVRFYRTVILDEINKDYVRTARAKGVPLPAILFVHVLKNCMLPILTNVISSLPFLIMGSLLLERFFGIPGLGDLMLTSITSRDVPIITGLTFLTAVLYVLSLLLTDILYAVFDPRIRLQ